MTRAIGGIGVMIITSLASFGNPRRIRGGIGETGGGV